MAELLGVDSIGVDLSAKRCRKAKALVISLDSVSNFAKKKSFCADEM